MKMVKLALTAMIISTCLLGTAFAATEQEEAVALVEKAVALVKAQGKDKALAEISNPQGQFVKGELYVFVYDMTATVVAHPVNSKLIGKNLLEVPDADGKLFRKEIQELAKTKGTGWVDYKYKNPQTSKIESKTSYFKKEGDIILCCGVYK